MATDCVGTAVLPVRKVPFGSIRRSGICHKLVFSAPFQYIREYHSEWAIWAPSYMTVYLTDPACILPPVLSITFCTFSVVFRMLAPRQLTSTMKNGLNSARLVLKMLSYFSAQQARSRFRKRIRQTVQSHCIPGHSHRNSHRKDRVDTEACKQILQALWRAHS